MYVTCHYPNYLLDLYDLVDGSWLGEFSCGTPATIDFDGVGGDSYALLEIGAGNTCNSQRYQDCKAQNFYKSEYDFSMVSPTPKAIVTPFVSVTAPIDGTIFSNKGKVAYTTQNATQVNLSYTDKVPLWDGSFVSPSDETSIATNVAKSGTYIWDTTKLIAGKLYRIIVDALGTDGHMGEALSGLFSVDFTPPTFIVSTDPPVTNGKEVTIKIDASENLGNPPVVTVTQAGASPVAVAMTGEGSHYEGTYQVVKGHDGIATIAVSGADVAGNTSTAIVSGGTFAVGVNPPPAPKLGVSSANTIIVSTSTFAVAGTLRSDTFAVLMLNGTSTLTASTSPNGAFSFPSIALSPTTNRGLNTLSIVARDTAGLVSAPATIRVKYEIAPTVTLMAPAPSAIANGRLKISASGIDENGDPLTYTYQIIPANDYAATVSESAWDTIADALPGGDFSWDSTEVEDGQYYLRATVDDGITKVSSEPVPFFVHNTLPYFRFDDGRTTVASSSAATIRGHAFAPSSISPQPTIKSVEYSLNNGLTWKTVALTSGANTSSAAFSLTLTKLAEGTQGILWRARDSRNLYGRTSHPIIVDETPPQAPLVNRPANGAFVSDTDDVDPAQAGLQIGVSGTAEPASIITLALASSTETVRTLPDGSWSFASVNVPQRGANTFVVTAADTAGNVSAPKQITIIYDNPPTVSITSPKPYRGFAGKGAVTWDIRDTDGDTIRNVMLAYRAGDGAFTTLPIDPTKGSYAFDAAKLAEGSDYEFLLSASDGFATSTDRVPFAIDRTPPVLTAFTLDKTVIGKGGVLAGRGTAHDALSGIEYVEYAVSREGETPQFVTALLTSGFLGNDAAFSISYPAALADGSYTVSARAVDAAGNVSPVSTEAIMIDTAPPHVGSFDILADKIKIDPDEQGIIALYKGIPATLEVSLEDDTAQAQLSVGSSTILLVKDIASGLWQGRMPAVATTTPLFISAVDKVGNAITNVPLGTLMTLDPGTIRARAGDTTEPLSDADMTVLVLQEGTGSFVPFSGIAGLVRGDDGVYELALPQGTYRLVATKSGYRPAENEITLHRAGFVNASFILEPYEGFWGFIERIIDNLSSIL